jgi:hypothetical protein
LTNILRLGWGGISCPFMTSHGLSLREAPWSAVAAATAFLALALARLRDESMAEGGSCCYRTPRLKGAHIELGPTKDARLRLRRAALLLLYRFLPSGLEEPQVRKAGPALPLPHCRLFSHCLCRL